MGFVSRIARRALAALVCLSLLVWAAAPATSHAPTAFETIQDHRDRHAEHGHAHGFDEDLFRALQGFGPDAADHDHGQAMLALGDPSGQTIDRDAWRPRPDSGGPSRLFLIERPPRA